MQRCYRVVITPTWHLFGVVFCNDIYIATLLSFTIHSTIKWTTSRKNVTPIPLDGARVQYNIVVSWVIIRGIVSVLIWRDRETSRVLTYHLRHRHEHLLTAYISEVLLRYEFATFMARPSIEHLNCWEEHCIFLIFYHFANVTGKRYCMRAVKLSPTGLASKNSFRKVPSAWCTW